MVEQVLERLVALLERGELVATARERSFIEAALEVLRLQGLQETTI